VRAAGAVPAWWVSPGAHAGSAWCRAHMLLRHGRGSDEMGVFAGASPCPRRPPPPMSKDRAAVIAEGRGEAARFNFPDGIALAVNDEIVVADTNNHAIRVDTPGGLCARSPAIPRRCSLVI